MRNTVDTIEVLYSFPSKLRHSKSKKAESPIFLHAKMRVLYTLEGLLLKLESKFLENTT